MSSPLSSTAASDGLRSEALRAALGAALAGRPAALDDLLSRLGRAEGPRPNLRLAAAFGAELVGLKTDPAAVVRLLAHLGDVDAEADKPAAFLPIAAAHGWVALLQAGREKERAWAAIAELAADGRTPVRLGALDGLVNFAAGRGSRDGRPGDVLLRQAQRWLDDDAMDREVVFGSAAAVVEVFGEARAVTGLADPEALLTYLARAIDSVADAPRAAERSDARRRLLLALPRTLGAVVANLNADDRGASWLEAECIRARHPDVREALSNTLVRFASRGADPGTVITDRLRAALKGSAKPDRDPTRRRPGAARGKASRPVR